MKTKLKKLSKRSVSILLSLLMIVSTFTVGIVATNAAFVDSASVGYNSGYIVSEGTSWADNKVQVSNDSSGTSMSNVQLHLNPGEKFKFIHGDSEWRGPGDSDTSYTPSSTDSYAWSSGSGNYYLTDAWESGNFTVTASVEWDGSKNQFKWHMTRSTTDTWYLSGVINGSNIGKSNNSYKFTKGSNAYTYTTSFVSTGVDQYFTVNNGSLVYQCGTSNGSSGAEADACYWGKDDWAYNSSHKWKISASSAPSGSTVTVTWNNKARTISWSVDSSTAGYYIHAASSNSGVVSQSGTQMTKVSDTQYTYTLSAGTYYVMINTSSSASSTNSPNKAKKTSSAISMDPGVGADNVTVGTEYSITKEYNLNGTKYYHVYVNSSSSIEVSYDPSSGVVTFGGSVVAFDGYYLSGRFAIASDIDGNTTGTAVNEHPDGYHITNAPAGQNDNSEWKYWTFEQNSTRVKFAETNTTNLYKLETNRTIAQLSETKSNTGHDPFYFVVHDKNNVLATSNSQGNNFQNFTGPTSSGTVLTLSPTSGPATATVTSQQMVFNNRDNQSDGKVVIWLDTSSYTHATDSTAASGTARIWYTVESETPAAADSVNITATPSPLTTGKQRTITAELVNQDTNKFALGTLTYTFTVKNSSGTTLATYTQKTDSDVVTVTDTRDTDGTYTYSVEVSGKQSDSTTDLRTLTASTTAVYRPAGVYVTTTNLNNYIDGSTSVTWHRIEDDEVPYTIPSSGVAANNSFTLALSGESGFTVGYEAYNISDPDNRFYDIKQSYVTATPIDGDETADITTYVVTARPGCTITSIQVNKTAKTIRAIASYTKTDTDSTKNSSKTVRYYFAEQKDEMGTSDPKSSIGDNKGMRIAYWNNSLHTADSGYTTVDVVNGVTSTGLVGTSYATASTNTSGNNNIFVSTSELNASDKAWDSVVGFKIYAVDLPVWATSFRFIKSNDGAIAAEPVNMTDKYDAWDHCTALNPNRVYLLYNYKGSLSSERYFVKGVVLDKSLWTSGRTAGDTRTINYTVTEKFKSNIINYKDITSLENPDNGVNSGLKTYYKTTNASFPNPLYFGYMTSTDTSAWGANYKKWDNVANSYNNNHRSYFASVWGLTGITNSTISTDSAKRSLTNDNGYGLLLSSDSNYVHPLFDYNSLASNSNIATYVKQGADFEFYKSEFNGITTYSYDSLTDYNRAFSTTDNAWVGANTTDGKKYARGTDSDGAHYYGLFPFGGNDDKIANTGFGVEFDIDFYMTNSGYLTDAQNTKQDIVFNFSGDDDVWIYVDGVRVLDLGGAHKISAGSINFSEGKAYYKTTAKSTNSLSSSTDSYAVNSANMNVVDISTLMQAYGQKFDKTDATTKHKFQMFYMERGAFQSNCSISFNLPQATGLNINNKVLATNVNEGLKDAALISSNSDFFAYSIQDKTATNTEKSAVDTWATSQGASAPWAYSSNEAGTDYSSPAYPVYTGMSRLFNGIEYVLTASSGSGTETQTQFNVGDSFSPIGNVVYKVLEPNLKNPDADDTTITKKTTDDGLFYLLGNQGAQFDSKVPANTMVEVKQQRALGTVKENGSNPITFKAVANNDLGNYYTTGYTIVDDSNNKVIGSAENSIVSSDLLAADGRSSSNGFYYSNYSGKADDKRPRMTVTFTNEIAVGNIRIEKKIDDNTLPEKYFYFTVQFANVFGDTNNSTLREISSLKYKVYSTANNQEVYEDALTYGSRGIRLKPGQYAIIEGVPVETRFKVTENGTGGYSTAQIDKKAYKGGYAIGNRGVITGTLVQKPSDVVTDNFYQETLTGKQYTSTSDRSETVTETTGDITTSYTYYTNMIPTVSETDVSGNYVSLSNVVFTNSKESITVTFKYYNRDVVNGTVAHISSKPDSYSKKYSNLDTYTVYTDGDVFSYVDYERLLQDAAIDFYTSGETSITNIIDSYKMWTTQTAAKAAVENLINVGQTQTYKDRNIDVTYHTNSLGGANDEAVEGDSAKTIKQQEKWVTYKNEAGEDMTRLSTETGDYFNPEERETNAQFKGPNSVSKYENVKEIVVWLYNVPKQYNIEVYGYKNGTDTALTGKSVTFNGENATVYVANNKKADGHAYFNQRLGYALPGNTYSDVNSAGYLDAYGIDGYTGFSPYQYTDEEYTIDNNQYKFAYWAFDPDGKEIASTDYAYFYRVTNNIKLYAVYTIGEQQLKKGLTISKNGEDSYVDTNGVSWTRLNAMVSPYNVSVSDENIYQLTNINIYLSQQIRDNPATYTEAYVKSLFEAYKDQLKTIVENYYNVTEFSEKHQYQAVNAIPSLTLTTKGYVFTVAGSPLAAQLTNPALVTLSNKNRLQFTTTYKTSALNKNTTGKVMIMQAAAMNYAGEWVVSDNCLVYQYDKYVPAQQEGE